MTNWIHVSSRKVVEFPHCAVLLPLYKSVMIDNFRRCTHNGKFFHLLQSGHQKHRKMFFTWMTLIGRSVSFANCSRSILEGFGLSSKAFFKTSNCLGFIVVLGPLLLPLGLIKDSSSTLASRLLSSIPSSPSIEFDGNSVNSSPRSGRISVKPPILAKDSF